MEATKDRQCLGCKRNISPYHILAMQIRTLARIIERGLNENNPGAAIDVPPELIRLAANVAGYCYVCALTRHVTCDTCGKHIPAAAADPDLLEGGICDPCATRELAQAPSASPFCPCHHSRASHVALTGPCTSCACPRYAGPSGGGA